MNGRGLAVVFAEDVPTIANSSHPGKNHAPIYLRKKILNRGQTL